jgi:hypothetical protein
MTENDWRKPREKKAAKKAPVEAKASDWKAPRKSSTPKGNAKVSKAAWTQRKHGR